MKFQSQPTSQIQPTLSTISNKSYLNKQLVMNVSHTVEIVDWLEVEVQSRLLLLSLFIHWSDNISHLTQDISTLWLEHVKPTASAATAIATVSSLPLHFGDSPITPLECCESLSLVKTLILTLLMEMECLSFIFFYASIWFKPDWRDLVFKKWV